MTERRVDTETRPPASGPDSELWHICETHPYDDACGPGCRSYCGRDYEAALDGGIVVSLDDGPNDCVVCSDLFQGDPRT